MSIASPADYEGLVRVGRVVAATLKSMADYVRPGVSTADVDRVGARVLRQHGARSAPQKFYGFPGVNLISVNDEIVHGVPGDRVLRPGDLVSLDVTAELASWRVGWIHRGCGDDRAVGAIFQESREIVSMCQKGL